jgi:hypothetical protein
MGDLAELAASTAFPGRVRQFAADDPGHALALAVGAAWIEQPRGGHAAAVVPAARRGDPLVVAALALARRLALPNLSVIAAADPALPCVELSARERQPVRLASLGRDLRPTWPTGSLAQALDATAAREPLLLLPSRDARWGCDRAALLALAWVAGDGRRVAWELPVGTPLGAWAAELALIGRMQLPLKLLADPADLPWPPAERGLGRWWVAMPAAQDAAGALAWALAGEEAVLLAMPGRMEGGDAWLPGSAKRLAEGEAGTMLCAGHLPARTPPGYGLLQLGSLIPLPQAALSRAARPLLAEDEELARHLACLDPHLRCTLAPPSDPPHSPR